MEKTIKRGVNHPLEKLKKLFSTKVIWCVVVLHVLISILTGVGVEFAINKELLSKAYSFGQSYPLIAKCISVCLKISLKMRIRMRIQDEDEGENEDEEEHQRIRMTKSMSVNLITRMTMTRMIMSMKTRG